jgi:hypothetical protein
MLQWMEVADWLYRRHLGFSSSWLPYPANKGLLRQRRGIKRALGDEARSEELTSTSYEFFLSI